MNGQSAHEEVLLIMRKMQSKIERRYYYIPIRTTKTKMATIPNADEDAETLVRGEMALPL